MDQIKDHWENRRKRARLALIQKLMDAAEVLDVATGDCTDISSDIRFQVMKLKDQAIVLAEKVMDGKPNETR